MSTRANIHNSLQGYVPGNFVAVCSFTTANGANPTVSGAQGVASVVRSGEGVWTVTTVEACTSMTVTVGFKGASATDSVQLGTKTPGSKTVVVNTYTNAVAAGVLTATADDCPGAIVDVIIHMQETYS